VGYGVTGVFIVAEWREQLDGALLIPQILAVLEREVHERAAVLVKDLIEPALDSPTGNLEGFVVRCERSRSPAEHVSRELIEQDDRRQRASWARQRGLRRLARNPFMQRKEAAADKLVSCVALLEPGFATQLLEPEFQDLFDPRLLLAG